MVCPKLGRLAPLLCLLVGCSSADDPDSLVDAGPSGAGGSSDAGLDAPPNGAGGAGGAGGSGSGGAPGDEGPARYPNGALQSPMSKSVVDGLRAVLAASSGRDAVFAKVGDSNTVNTNFLNCFDGPDLWLGEHAALEASRVFFGETLVDGTDSSYDRISLAAAVGWSAGNVIAGSPSALEQEVQAITPAFAVVMLGTNETYAQGVEPFDKNLLTIVDRLLELGVVPLLSTIPPRGDSAEANDLVPEMNAVVRAIAQSRQVPLMDLWLPLHDLPEYGLAGDGIHLQVYVSGGAKGCWLTPEGLALGMNQRNLLTLEALDRARRFLIEGEPPEASPPPLAGAGTWRDPIVIDALPFVDGRDTSQSLVSEADLYSCGAQDEGGPEVVYRVVLDAPTTLRARVFDADSVDVDLQWLSGPSGAECVARGDKVLDVTAEAGTYWLTADSFVSGGAALAGAYRLTLVALP